MNRKKLPLWMYLAMGIFLYTLAGCKHDPDPIIDDRIITSNVCHEDTVYFQNDVLPLLLGTCGTTGCHDISSYKHGVVLVDYLSVMRTGGINLGNPASSDIYHVLGDGNERMPPSPDPEWTDAQKQALLTWISQGAINNQCMDQLVCDTLNVTFAKNVLPLFDKYCLSCHSGANPQYNLDLTNFDHLAAIIDNGALLGSINHEPGYNAMPKNMNKLTPCEIRTIEIWANDTVFPGGGGTGHPCDPDTVYFENDILPLLISNCSTSGCHDQASAQDGVVLVDYASIINTGEVVPGDPGNSELYEVLVETDPEKRMPLSPADPLTSEQIQKVNTWIAQGAKNNRCDGVCDTTNVTYATHVWPLIQSNCTGCHSGANPGAGTFLTDHQTIAAAAATGKLYGSVAHLSGYAPMPKNATQLSECDLAAIRIWIENGTPND